MLFKNMTYTRLEYDKYHILNIIIIKMIFINIFLLKKALT